MDFAPVRPPISVATDAGSDIDLTNLDFPDVPAVAWSTDGESIAYRRDLCHARALSCIRSQSRLYVFDVQSRATRLVAVVDREIASITFSHDGTRLAYFASAEGAASAIYVAPVPSHHSQSPTPTARRLSTVAGRRGAGVLEGAPRFRSARSLLAERTSRLNLASVTEHRRRA